MRMLILSFAGLSLVCLSQAAAQDSEIYYDDYVSLFGEEEGSADQDDGPATIAEAKKEGRGYVIGRKGVHGRSPREMHGVVEGDTLWDISDKYFGSPWHWPQLWSFNPEVTNPHWIYPEDQLRLTEQTLVSDIKEARRMGSSVGPSGVVMPTTGDLSPTVVLQTHKLKPGTVFLRDMGYLDNEGFKTAGHIVGGNEEHMFLSPSDQVYVQFAEGQDVRAGQEYVVFRTMHEYERHPAEEGTLVRTFGTIVIRSYDRDNYLARGVITDAMDPIERGFKVAMMPRKFDLVAPARNESNVVAHVIASIRPRQLMAYGNVVFLDVGREEGVKAGNRFFVVRRGDEWRQSISTTPNREPHEMGNIVEVDGYDEDILPKEVVAELRVIKVRANTTIALVTRSDFDILNGEVAEMRKGF